MSVNNLSCIEVWTAYRIWWFIIFLLHVLGPAMNICWRSHVTLKNVVPFLFSAIKTWNGCKKYFATRIQCNSVKCSSATVFSYKKPFRLRCKFIVQDKSYCTQKIVFNMPKQIKGYGLQSNFSHLHLKVKTFHSSRQSFMKTRSRIAIDRKDLKLPKINPKSQLKHAIFC